MSSAAFSSTLFKPFWSEKSIQKEYSRLCWRISTYLANAYLSNNGKNSSKDTFWAFGLKNILHGWIREMSHKWSSLKVRWVILHSPKTRTYKGTREEGKEVCERSSKRSKKYPPLRKSRSTWDSADLSTSPKVKSVQLSKKRKIWRFLMFSTAYLPTTYPKRSSGRRKPLRNALERRWKVSVLMMIRYVY